MRFPAGCGGRKLSDVQHEQPVWLEHAERKYGFGKVSVRGRHLRFEYIHSETGHVADSVDLKIGRSAVRSCNTLGAEGKSQGIDNQMRTAREEILAEGTSLQGSRSFLVKGLQSLSSSTNNQLQKVAVQ